MKLKSDHVFLGIFGILLTNAIIQRFLNNYILSVNTYCGLLCWVVVVISFFKNLRYKRYALGFLIFLGLFNILNFSFATMSSHFAVGSLETPRLNPLTFLLTIPYYFINMRSINRIIASCIKGTANEQQEGHKKKVAFYLQTFETSTPSELEVIFNNVNDYPIEAREAIDQIREKQRTIS